MRQRLRLGGGDSSTDRVAQLLEEPELDVSEQRELIAALERAQATQSRAWRAVFGALGLVLASLFAWCAWWQAEAPWIRFRHHGVFHRTLSARGVAAAEAASAGVFLLGAGAMLVRGVLPSRGSAEQLPLESGAQRKADRGAAAGQLEQRLATVAVVTGAAMAAFWSWALRVSFTQKRVDSGQAVGLLWLPFAPLAYAVLMWSVLRMLRGTEAELKALRSQMYNLHKA